MLVTKLGTRKTNNRVQTQSCPLPSWNLQTSWRRQALMKRLYLKKDAQLWQMLQDRLRCYENILKENLVWERALNKWRTFQSKARICERPCSRRKWEEVCCLSASARMSCVCSDTAYEKPDHAKPSEPSKVIQLLVIFSPPNPSSPLGFWCWELCRFSIV